MMIAITSKGTDINSDADPRFGRCKYFLIYDTETGEYKAVENQNAFASGGAGVSSAQFIAEQGVKAVITGNVGPKALQILEASGIKVFTGAGDTVKDAIDGYKQGKLDTAQQATVSSHFGLKNKRKE